jgi:hypothetical protein
LTAAADRYDGRTLITPWRFVLGALVVTAWFLGGCSSVPTVQSFNGSFTLGLEGWEVYPQDRGSVVGEDKVLNVALSSSERVSLLKTVPLDPETEGVRISFKVRYQRGSIPRTNQQNSLYRLILQEPGTRGDEGYNAGTYLVNLAGGWETHTIVQLYQKHEPGDRNLRLRPLPKALVIKIILDEGDGSFQFDDFRVQEFVTSATIVHD